MMRVRHAEGHHPGTSSPASHHDGNSAPIHAGGSHDLFGKPTALGAKKVSTVGDVTTASDRTASVVGVRPVVRTSLPPRWVKITGELS